MAGARLGDMFGRKRMLLLGLAGFVAASALCSFAWSGDVLVASRALQGLAAAVMVPQSFGLIRDVFPPQQIGKAFAAMGPVIGLSTVLGPVVAGAADEGRPVRQRLACAVPDQPADRRVRTGAGEQVLPDGAPSHAGLRLDGVGTALLGDRELPGGVPAGRRTHAGLADLDVRAAGRLRADAGAVRAAAAGAAACRSGAAGRVQRAAQAVLRVRHRVHAGVLRQHRRVLADDRPVPADRAGLHPDAREPLPRRDGGRRVLRLRGRRLGADSGRPADPARRADDHGRGSRAALRLAAARPTAASASATWRRACSSSASAWG